MSSNKEIILVKLGGSIITDKSKDSTVNTLKIEQLTKELAEVVKEGNQIILAHGAGSFGHPQASQYKTAEGNINSDSRIGFSIVRKAVKELNTLMVNQLIKNGVPAVGYSPMAFLSTDNKSVEAVFMDPLETMLKHHLIPVIHGDVILDKKTGWTIFSGEKILNIIAIELIKKGYPIKRMIEVGDTAGVYDDNKQTIAEITPENIDQVEKYISGSGNTDVTGGMLHKVKEAIDLTTQGVSTFLISSISGNLNAVINNASFEGTLITK